MATTKPLSTLIIFLNIAMFTVISTHAACPDLSACLNIANGLLNVQAGSQANSNCCQLIGGLVGVEATACLCSSLLQNSLLGSLLPSILGITQGLPLIGGLLSPLLGGLPLGLLTNVLDKEVLAFVNACGLDATKFKCS